MNPVTINSVEAILVDLPTIRAHQLAMAVMQRQTLVIVRLRCSDGIEGIGEATTIGGLSYGEESPEGIKLAIDTYLAPALAGLDAANIHAAMRRLETVARGNRFAKSALESALLDAQGKRLGVSVSTLLGGAVRASLPVLWTLASGDTARDIEEAESLLASRRHNTFKLKVGRRAVADDVAHVSRIKQALGDRARVTVDVNQAWNEADAAGAIARLEAAGVDLIEQPIPRANLAGMARLAPNGLLMQNEGVDVACLKPSLVRVLKTIEAHYKRKIVVTSGYRDIDRNTRARGAKNSLHMYCAAADIQVPGVGKWELASYVRSMPGRGGVGTYCHTESVHVDVGPERDWNWRCRRRK